MTIDVTAVNDAPVIAQNTLTLTSGASVTLSGAQLSATDVDDPAAGLLFSVSAVSHGQFELVSAPSVAIVSFSQAQISAGQVRFVHDASTSAPSYDVSVSDGTLNAGPAPASISFNLNSAAAGIPTPGPVLPPTTPSVPSVPPPAAPEPAPLPSPTDSGGSSSSDSSAASGGGDGGGGNGSGGGGGDGGHGAGPGAAAGVGMIGVLDNQSAAGRPPRMEVRGFALAQLKLSSGAPEVHSLPPLDLGLLIQSSDPQYTKFEGSASADWSISSVFNDETSLKPQKEQFSVLLDSAQMGGIALSVGVVWWASRVTGVIGSLLASLPAWRQLDPLPVVGRDDDEGEWDDQDRYAYADELAISMVLEGPRDAAPMPV